METQSRRVGALTKAWTKISSRRLLRYLSITYGIPMTVTRILSERSQQNRTFASSTGRMSLLAGEPARPLPAIVDISLP